mgnify:CR=1 FL=1
MWYSINAVDARGSEYHYGTFNGKKATAAAYAEILQIAEGRRMKVIDGNFDDCSEYFAKNRADTGEAMKRAFGKIAEEAAQ